MLTGLRSEIAGAVWRAGGGARQLAAADAADACPQGCPFLEPRPPSCSQFADHKVHPSQAEGGRACAGWRRAVEERGTHRRWVARGAVSPLPAAAAAGSGRRLWQARQQSRRAWKEGRSCWWCSTLATASLTLVCRAAPPARPPARLQRAAPKRTAATTKRTSRRFRQGPLRVTLVFQQSCKCTALLGGSTRRRRWRRPQPKSARYLAPYHHTKGRAPSPSWPPPHHYTRVSAYCQYSHASRNPCTPLALLQIRSADEPATLFFRCAKCGSNWREG